MRLLVHHFDVGFQKSSPTSRAASGKSLFIETPNYPVYASSLAWSLLAGIKVNAIGRRFPCFDTPTLSI